MAAAADPAVAARHAALTEEAVARGVFGAPSYVYRDEIFWGQDRLDFLDRAVGKS
jgi:2-hydroxychromene-2-carboxylate isomerase